MSDITQISGLLIKDRSLTNDDIADDAKIDASKISAIVSEFSGSLSPNENTLQKALDKLDDHTHRLESISNVNIDNPTANQVLSYNGSKWINKDDTSETSTVNKNFVIAMSIAL